MSSFVDAAGRLSILVALGAACATSACVVEDDTGHPRRWRTSEQSVEDEDEDEDENENEDEDGARGTAPTGVVGVTNDLGDEESAQREVSPALFEGDIVLDPESDRPSVAGNAAVSRPWPGGIVVYAIDPNLPARERIGSAMKHWESRTGIRFRPRTNETAYVAFVPGIGCSSHIGRRGGRQDITLEAGCDAGTVVHEIGHAVGLWHEQSRSDRDSFVRVHLENVQKGMELNFSKTTFTSAGRYDLGSIMHYGSSYFSANGRATMTKLDGSLITPQRSALSTGDIEGIRAIYANEKTPQPQPGSATATTTAGLNLRTGPGIDHGIILVMPAGAVVSRTGRSQSGFDSVIYQGTAGWAYASYLQ